MGERIQTTKELLTVNNIRFNNKVNILTNIVQQEDLTRNDLAKRSQISIMTVKHIVDELLEGRIIEERVCRSAVGRKPMALNVAGRYGNIVCINLTSIDEISYIVYDLKENIIAQEKHNLKKQNKKYQEKLLSVIGLIKKCVANIGTSTVGIAVFVPSAYYEEEDLVNYDLIGEFKDFHIKKLLMEEFHLDNVQIIHDTYAAAKSEYENMDVTKDSQFYFYCGDGVGGFFIHKGVAIKGENLIAGEVGKLLLSFDKSRKKQETLEERLAVPGIMKRMEHICPGMDFAEVLSAYGQGDERVAHIMDEVLNTVSVLLYNIIWIYNPTRIVVDSCYKEYSSLMEEKAREFISEFQEEAIEVNTQIVKAQYEEYHMMRGCMKLVREKWIEKTAFGVADTEGLRE